MGAGHQKDQAMIRSLKFSAPSPFFRDGGRAGNGVNDRSYLCDEASIKILKVWDSESFQVDEHLYIVGR